MGQKGGGGRPDCFDCVLAADTGWDLKKLPTRTFSALWKQGRTRNLVWQKADQFKISVILDHFPLFSLAPLNPWLTYDIPEFYYVPLCAFSERDTWRRLITDNDRRLAADWLSAAKYEFGLMIRIVRKNWEIIGHMWLSHTLFNCHFQFVRAWANWAVEEEEKWRWCEFDMCCLGSGLSTV